MARIRWNRKGFTLLEVLVSIAVIGVVFLPMLTFFSDSTAKNIQVKNIQRANTVGQSVVEEFRAYSTIQTLVEKYANDETGNLVVTDKKYEKITPKTFNDDGSFNTNISGDHKYYFVKQNIESDGKKYFAQIEVDPTAYKDLNDKGVPVISSLGSESTVVAKEEDETLNKLYEYQKLHFNKTGVNVSVEELAGKIKKTMKVVFSDTVTSKDKDGKDVTEPVADGMVHVRVYSEYELRDSYEGCEGTQVGADIYDGLMEEEQLKAVYLFYNYDVYNMTQTGDIMQGLEVIIDYKKPAENWTCDYTVYSIFQHINLLKDERELNKEESENYVKMFNVHMPIRSESNITGQKANIWTNFSTGDGSYETKKMEDIVGTEKIQRLSKLTVKVYNKKEPTKLISTFTSTRGE